MCNYVMQTTARMFLLGCVTLSGCRGEFYMNLVEKALKMNFTYIEAFLQLSTLDVRSGRNSEKSLPFLPSIGLPEI